ncbi:hypothetical protein FQR65_LT02917 [Abscondita terminalis]|nr:hypothetical protein FQR65_LT02917 [Abscondita terminalis]
MCSRLLFAVFTKSSLIFAVKNSAYIEYREKNKHKKSYSYIDRDIDNLDVEYSVDAVLEGALNDCNKIGLLSIKEGCVSIGFIPKKHDEVGIETESENETDIDGGIVVVRNDTTHKNYDSQ